MGNVISVTNQKGGVGKTTTALHLAFGIAESDPDKKILLIDLDPQRNATGVILQKTDFDPKETAFSLFQKNRCGSEVIHETSLPNLWAIPSHIQLVEVETMLSNAVDGFFRLKDQLAPLETEFDYIIIDCPPSLSVLTINALVAARYLIVPLQVSKFSLDGITSLLEVVETVKNRYNGGLEIVGALFTFYDDRTTLARTMADFLSEKIKLLETTIPKSIAVEEAHLMKKSLFEYAPGKKITESYRTLATEITNEIQKR